MKPPLFKQGDFVKHIHFEKVDTVREAVWVCSHWCYRVDQGFGFNSLRLFPEFELV